ncbi:uncharacterized protein J7T55_002359 [Diaporthe amygdali]|uniref:uncharacterized protein n=1 Tax=Phomopsis amygdali TaxID=1214568 RepID=UPI0022FE25D7|nr:uncharacterized protein J7T55_002359 [Diaporthe amygdali]KAJ0103743.1 uncharacterized protein J7T55_002359 [Diaporthe amygdali]
MTPNAPKGDVTSKTEEGRRVNASSALSFDHDFVMVDTPAGRLDCSEDQLPTSERLPGDVQHRVRRRWAGPVDLSAPLTAGLVRRERRRSNQALPNFNGPVMDGTKEASAGERNESHHAHLDSDPTKLNAVRRRNPRFDDPPGRPRRQPSKREKKPAPSLESLVKELTGSDATKRIRSHALACAQQAPALPEGCDEQKFLNLAREWEKKSEFSSLVSYIWRAYGVERMYLKVRSKLVIESGAPDPKLPTGIINEFAPGLGEERTPEAVRRRLTLDRKLVKLCDYLPFMPFGGKATVTFQHFERLPNDDIEKLRRHLNSSPHAQKLAKIGKAFRHRILKLESFLWEDISVEDLRELHSDTLLHLLTIRRYDQLNGTWGLDNTKATEFIPVRNQCDVCMDERCQLLGFGRNLASKQSGGTEPARVLPVQEDPSPPPSDVPPNSFIEVQRSPATDYNDADQNTASLSQMCMSISFMIEEHSSSGAHEAMRISQKRKYSDNECSGLPRIRSYGDSHSSTQLCSPATYKGDGPASVRDRQDADVSTHDEESPYTAFTSLLPKTLLGKDLRWIQPSSPSPLLQMEMEWKQHQIFRGDENDRSNGNSDVVNPAVSDTSSVAKGSPVSTAPATTAITRSEYSHFPPSQSSSLLGGAITALQSPQLPFNLVALASPRDTEHSLAIVDTGSDISAAATDASTAGSYRSIATTNVADIANITDVKLIECVSGGQERLSTTTDPPAIYIARDLSQPLTPRSEPSPLLYTNHPLMQTTPMRPDLPLPINQTVPTMKENLNWGTIFTTKNFGDKEDGTLADGVLADGVLAHDILKECFHEDQSKMTVEDIPQLRKEGYIHWTDQSIGLSIDLKSRSEISSFWSSDGWGILNSILANARIRGILSDWFKGPCLIAHWMRWGILSTGGTPTFLARNAVKPPANSEFDIPYLGLHVMCAATSVKCYARSHREAWPVMTKTWFTNSREALQAHNISEELSNGL